MSVDAAERQSLLALSKVVHEVGGKSVILYLIGRVKVDCVSVVS